VKGLLQTRCLDEALFTRNNIERILDAPSI
jgi:hypothetical protein